jgi:ribosomal protein L14E/L6E/L27E
MSMFEEHTVVILMKGRHAGCKAVVLKTPPEEKYIRVAGIDKYPKKVKEGMAEKQKKKAGGMSVFIKKINPMHALITRYKADVGLGKVDHAGAFDDPVVRKKTLNEVRKIMEDAYTLSVSNGESHFLFRKLKF